MVTQSNNCIHDDCVHCKDGSCNCLSDGTFFGDNCPLYRRLYLNKVEICDAMEALDRIKGVADLLVTDPPYKTITGGDSDGKNSVRPKGMLGGNRKLFDYQTELKPSDWMSKVYAALKDNTQAYIFTNVLNLEEMLAAARSVGFKLHNVLVWEKNNCTPSQYYMKNCEYILFLRKGKAKYVNNIGASKTVHQFANVRGKRHPCEKPVDLLRFYIENSSIPGDIVLDPFAGCGSTMEAALSCGRNFVGFEINPQWRAN